MISDRLKQVILRELELEDWDMHDATTADTVPGWDSLNHARVITAVEQTYGIRFKTMEVLRLKNVGDLQALIDRKTS
jgi:acyl carrier protein